MIRLVVGVCSSSVLPVLSRTLDATPWFEQASKAELAQLKSERSRDVYGANIVWYSYEGERTMDIFGWLSQHHPSKESEEILNFSDEVGEPWQVELYDEDVQRYFQQKKTRVAAIKAVDKLMGL